MIDDFVDIRGRERAAACRRCHRAVRALGATNEILFAATLLRLQSPPACSALPEAFKDVVRLVSTKLAILRARPWHQIRYQVVRLHWSVLSAAKGMVRDHINGNTLDNRSSNLRTVTVAQSNQNRFHRRGSMRAVRRGRTGWIASMQCGDICKKGRFRSCAAACIAAELWRRRYLPFAWRVDIEAEFGYLDRQLCLPF
ncbi:MAG: HNH endonuclease [Candidatus Eremiobacteraeota bacterium]|nr:HNH endonuclease [Candidatus Eremiobacteraeota bacterium]